jgi:hypothetical protein
MMLGAVPNPAKRVVKRTNHASRLATGSLNSDNPVNKPAAMAVAGTTFQLIAPAMTEVGCPGGIANASLARVIAPAVRMIPAAVAIARSGSGQLDGQTRNDVHADSDADQKPRPIDLTHDAFPLIPG